MRGGIFVSIIKLPNLFIYLLISETRSCFVAPPALEQAFFLCHHAWLHLILRNTIMRDTGYLSSLKTVHHQGAEKEVRVLRHKKRSSCCWPESGHKELVMASTDSQKEDTGLSATTTRTECCQQPEWAWKILVQACQMGRQSYRHRDFGIRVHSI